MKFMKKFRQRLVVTAFFLISGPIFAGSYQDFFKAIQLDQPRAIEKLLQRGFDPNTPNPDGVPALLQALTEQSFQAAVVLARHPQIQADVRNSRGESPLMLAANRAASTR